MMTECATKILAIKKYKPFKTKPMKTKFIYGLSLMLCLTLMSTTCEDDDIIIIDNSAEIQEIKNTVESGTWQITSFIDSGVDETNHYTGFSFTFDSNGTLTATNNTNTYTGTWSITDDDDSDDDSNSSSDIDFNISFLSPETFNDDLTEDWDIVMRTNSKIELIHISGGNGGTDNLIFEKI